MNYVYIIYSSSREPNPTPRLRAKAVKGPMFQPGSAPDKLGRPGINSAFSGPEDHPRRLATGKTRTAGSGPLALS